MKTELKAINGGSWWQLFIQGERESIEQLYNSLFNWGATGTRVFPDQTDYDGAESPWIGDNCLSILTSEEKLFTAFYNIAEAKFKAMWGRGKILPKQQKLVHRRCKAWARAKIAQIKISTEAVHYFNPELYRVGNMI